MGEEVGVDVLFRAGGRVLEGRFVGLLWLSDLPALLSGSITVPAFAAGVMQSRSAGVAATSGKTLADVF